jgi:hypothetical protein
MASLRGEFLDYLSTAEEFIFANENSFMFEFTGGFAKQCGLSNELVSVSFSAYGVKIVYVTPDGQHVSGVIEASQYNDWVSHRCVVNIQQLI